MHHLTFASDGRLALFPDETVRRTALRSLVPLLADRALLFCLVDDHLHVVMNQDRPDAGRSARAILLRLRSPVPALSPAYIRPVENRSHLQWLVRYCIEQPRKHGLECHPALWSGSCFPDLVGARWLPGLSLGIRAALPRLKTRELMAMAGMTGHELVPVPEEELLGLGAREILDATAAALGVGPVLSGNEPAVARARAVFAHLCPQPASTLAWALGVTPQAARRLRARPVEAEAIKAVRLRLALERRLAEGLVAGSS